MNKKQKTLRGLCLGFSFFLLVVLIFSMLIMRCQSDDRFSIFGIRFCTKVGGMSTVSKGSLCIVDTGKSYDDNSQVEVSHANDHFISTAFYGDGKKIGLCVSAVPVLGYVFDAIATVPVISSLIFILFAVLVVLFANIGANNAKLKKHERFRNSFQFLYSVVTNSYIMGFAKGTIYKGQLKNICVPGLNCYSCPGAYGACPIGAMQAMFTKRTYNENGVGLAARFPFYVLGLIMLFGVICGRLVCGFLCPFGFVQDLLHKIKLPEKLKINTFKGDKQLRYFKYLVLLVFVILLPIFTTEAFPWFCKLICPSGMLIGGIPLMSLNEGLRSAAGLFTVLKLSVLFIIVLLSIMIYRPFCKYLCPLGAIYGLLNKVSLYHYEIDESKCTHCRACEKTCPMQVEVTKNIHSAECIRCGRCVSSCPTGALERRFNLGSKNRINGNEKTDITI